MSGGDVPYQLRPNKYVDRQLFVDLVQRVRSYKPEARYVYSSMGGRYMEDARAIYQSLGITDVYSIEENLTNLNRQEFNKPYEFIQCLHKNSKEFVDEFAFFSSQFEEDQNFIVWLDYTNPKDWLPQMEEYGRLLSQMSVWDIARITVNANAQALGSPKGTEDLMTRRLEVFKSRVGKYPSDATKEEMNSKDFPGVMARTLKTVAAKAKAGEAELVVKPIAVFSYSDGNHPMLSITCILLPADAAAGFFSHETITDWPHLPSDWGDVKKIDVPTLSLKEKTTMDRLLFGKTAEEIQDGLGFSFDETPEDSVRKIEQYIDFHRHYPSFVRADI